MSDEVLSALLKLLEMIETGRSYQSLQETADEIRSDLKAKGLLDE